MEAGKSKFTILRTCYFGGLEYHPEERPNCVISNADLKMEMAKGRHPANEMHVVDADGKHKTVKKPKSALFLHFTPGQLDPSVAAAVIAFNQGADAKDAMKLFAAPQTAPPADAPDADKSKSVSQMNKAELTAKGEELGLTFEDGAKNDDMKEAIKAEMDK